MNDAERALDRTIELAQARQLLARVVKYIRQAGASTPGSTRLARVVGEIEAFLGPDARDPLDRCAYLFADGSRCGLWRDSHGPQTFTPEGAHSFAEPGWESSP